MNFAGVSRYPMISRVNRAEFAPSVTRWSNDIFIGRINDLLAPLGPTLDFLTRPLEVVSLLAGPTSMLDLARLYGEASDLDIENVIRFVEYVDFLHDIASVPQVGDALEIKLGDLVLSPEHGIDLREGFF
jgi:hypothetical protein